MNKAELVRKIAEKTGMSQAKTRKFLDTFIEVMEEELVRGGEVKLLGFGTFRVVKRKGRKGTDPRTRKPIKIPAKKVVKFRAGKRLTKKLAEVIN